MANSNPIYRIPIDTIVELYLTRSLRQTAKILGKDYLHIRNRLQVEDLLRPVGKPIRYLTPNLRKWKEDHEK